MRSSASSSSTSRLPAVRCASQRPESFTSPHDPDISGAEVRALRKLGKINFSERAKERGASDIYLQMKNKEAEKIRQETLAKAPVVKMAIHIWLVVVVLTFFADGTVALRSRLLLKKWSLCATGDNSSPFQPDDLQPTISKIKDKFYQHIEAENALTEMGCYVPSMGIESAIYTTAHSRSLLQNEFDLVFDRFPGLVLEARSGKWPKANRGENGLNYDKSLTEALKFYDFKSDKPVRLKDVEEAVAKFRKVVGDLDNNRSNYPILVANHYRNMAKLCLLEEDKGEGWGSCANALEYAGFVIEDHVSKVEIDKGQEIFVLSLQSMWTQVAVCLLDREFSSNISNEAQHDKVKSMCETMGQRFFGQSGMDEDDIATVQDMFLSTMRVSLRTVLSRIDTTYVVVDIPVLRNDGKGRQQSLSAWAPPLSAVKTVLTLDFEVLEEDDDIGGGEVVRFFVSNMSGSSSISPAVGKFNEKKVI